MKKPAAKTILMLSLGAVAGAAVTCVMPYAGFNLRLLPYTKQGHTISPTDRGIHARPLESLFSRFAHGLRLPCTSEETAEVLGTGWVEPGMIHGIYVIGGKIPLSGSDASQPYVISFPENPDYQGASVWIGLSGGQGTVEEAYDFLSGRGDRRLRLTEFALNYPPSPGRPGRIETFTRWRISVWEF